MVHGAAHCQRKPKPYNSNIAQGTTCRIPWGYVWLVSEREPFLDECLRLQQPQSPHTTSRVNNYNFSIIMNTDGTGTIVSESGVQSSHYHYILYYLSKGKYTSEVCIVSHYFPLKPVVIWMQLFGPREEFSGVFACSGNTNLRNFFLPINLFSCALKGISGSLLIYTQNICFV